MGVPRVDGLEAAWDVPVQAGPKKSELSLAGRGSSAPLGPKQRPKLGSENSPYFTKRTYPRPK
jgi:hypothetical protein